MPEEARPLVALADAHLGDGSAADDGCEDGVRWAIAESLVYEPVAVVFLGDMRERMMFPWEAIYTAHRGLFAWIDDTLGSRGIPLWDVQGNHDLGSLVVHTRQLQQALPHVAVSGFEQVTWAGWTIFHGHQLDPWCHGPLSVFSILGGAVGGLFERIIPGFDEQQINPLTPFNPPRLESNAYQMWIREAADAYVAKHGGRVLHGHTHRRRINHDRTVVCAGCCTKGRGEFAAIWPDGNVVLHEMVRKETPECPQTR